MSITSVFFVFIFLPAVIFLYYTICRTLFLKNLFLVLASLFFYAWGEPKFVFILILMTLINYVCGIFISNKINEGKKAESKKILIIGLFCNLAILFLVKYLGFTCTTINQIFRTNYEIPVIGLPLGISFYTFQAISYLMDVYRSQAKVQKNFINMALYITLFPKLLMGPMVRYSDIAPEIVERNVSFEDFKEALLRFVCGLAKKILLANQFAVVANEAFAGIDNGISVSFAWLGLLAYSLQILFDFTGYTDMAIAMGRMFGFHFTENFDYPYISTSVAEYWRRWHVTMGAFFRDYVYMPITMSPKLKKNPITKKRVKANVRITIAMIVTWFLTGLWHGAAWNYIVWGLYFFAAIFIEERVKPIKNPKLKVVIGFIVTTFIVKMGQVMFRAGGFLDALKYYKVMYGFDSTVPLFSANVVYYLKEYLAAWILGIVFCFPICRWVNTKIRSYEKLNYVVRICVNVGYVVVFMVCVAYMTHNTSSGFIYFNF